MQAIATKVRVGEWGCTFVDESGVELTNAATSIVEIIESGTGQRWYQKHISVNVYEGVHFPDLLLHVPILT